MTFRGQRRRRIAPYTWWGTRAKIVGNHQCLDTAVAIFLDQGDGWNFKVDSRWLERMPAKFGGKFANLEIGYASTPMVFRVKANEPVMPTGSNTFRVLRLPTSRRAGINFAAFHPGDEQFRSTIRWGTLVVPSFKGMPQK